LALASFSLYGGRRKVMIVPQDEEDLRRLLDVDEIPADIAEEYSQRIRFYHRQNQGPLGELGLIDLIRFCGYKAPGSPQPERVDWHQYRAGTRLEALVDAQWLPGEFKGFVAPGMIATLLDGSESVREVLARDARLPVLDYALADTVAVNSEPEVTEEPGEVIEEAHQYQPLPRVLVEADDDLLQGTVMSPTDDSEYMNVQIDGEELPRAVHMEKVTFI
jgi:hypothetical protein